MKTWFAVLLTSASLLPLQMLGQGNIVVNGSFENGWNNGPIGWGWTTNVGLGNGFPGVADGTSMVTVYGALFQTLATTPGQAYRVRFALASNSSFPGESALGLSWAGNFLGTTTWHSPNTTGNGLNFNWIYGEHYVQAASASTLLNFQVVGSTLQPFMDDVSVVAVPEPGVAAISVLGLAMLAGLARKRSNGAG
jgi:hypothetical protein